jgi:hypothetical protein
MTNTNLRIKIVEHRDSIVQNNEKMKEFSSSFCFAHSSLPALLIQVLLGKMKSTFEKVASHVHQE